jgi:NADH-quinone oxidoreductase subunit L
MYVPLVVLSVFAIGVGWTIFGYGVQPLLEQARPVGTDNVTHGVLLSHLVHPNEHTSHFAQFHVPAELVALATGLTGLMLAVVFYGLQILNPAEVKAQFRPIYNFLWHKWYFDELYNAVFVQPTLFIARRVAEFDKRVIDGLIDRLALGTRMLAQLDDLFDRYLVDGVINWASNWIYGVAIWFRGAQTGRVRQYVMFIVVGTVALFVLISFYLNTTMAGM